MAAVIKPPPLRPAVDGGYTLDDFAFDETVGTVHLPRRSDRADHRPTPRPFRPPLQRLPAAGPLHHRRPWTGHRAAPHHGLLAAARAFATTDAFTHPYRRHRPTVERSISWLVRDSRRLRYRGIDRNRLWLGHRVSAINLTRLVNLDLTHGPDGWAIA
jgi:Transposase DDE domain